MQSACANTPTIILLLSSGRPLLATAVFPMPDTVRSVAALRGVVAAAVHEQKLELAKRLL